MNGVRKFHVQNFGLGSRKVDKALFNASRELHNGCLGANAKTRLSIFSSFLAEKEIKDLRYVTRDVIADYGRSLIARGLTPATIKSYMGCVNVTLSQARGDSKLKVTPTEIGVEKRTAIATHDKAADPTDYYRIMSRLDGDIHPEIGAAISLEREFGMRFEEAAKIDAVWAVHDVNHRGEFTLVKTKGGRPRTLKIENERQLFALRKAAEIQIKMHGESLIPPYKTYLQHKAFVYNNYDIPHHKLRHLRGQEKYHEILGYPCLIKSKSKTMYEYKIEVARHFNISIVEAKDRIHNAMREVSQLLGHERISITRTYLG